MGRGEVRSPLLSYMNPEDTRPAMSSGLSHQVNTTAGQTSTGPLDCLLLMLLITYEPPREFPKVTWSETMPCLCVVQPSGPRTHEVKPSSRTPTRVRGSMRRNQSPEPAQRHHNHTQTGPKQLLAEAAEGAAVVPLEIHEVSNRNSTCSLHKCDFRAAVEMCLLSLLHLSYLSFIKQQCGRTQMDIPGEQKPR